ncbi:MAG: S-adenosylmethionine decarboxylase [Deltaproteobacteria bacterium]
MSLGVHLLIDADDCSAALDEAGVERALECLVERLALTAVAPPQIRAQADGVVGIVLISESHISIHTRGRAVHADVFSCRAFDEDLAVRTLREVFSFERCAVQRVERGAS